MKTICLSHICPNIFKDNIGSHSDIWNQNALFEKGCTYLIEARSGTGKSTLCSYLCGYRNDYKGHLTFDGADVSTFTISDWTDVRCRHISHMIQDLRLFPELSSFENVEIKNSLSNFKSEKEIMEYFDYLSIADKRDVPIRNLSFGQQQRVALIRALVQPFDFLIADEPISHLDKENAQLMAELMTSEAKKQEAGVIITSIGKHMSLKYDKIYHL